MRRMPLHPQNPAQQGAVSVVFAVLMLLLISAGVTAALRLSGAGLRDSVTQGAQSAALFLAESGIERAHALQSQAFAAGSFGASCQALATTGAGPYSLGRGSFSYTASSYQSSTCANTSATELSGECCTFTVTADQDGTRRVVQAQIETTDPNGVAGRDSTSKYLSLKTTEANTAIVTNLAYRAKDDGGSNADVNGCANLSSIVFTNCDELWDLASPGTYSVNGMSTFAQIPVAPTRYKIQVSFNANNSPAPRHYVLTGGFFPPAVSGVQKVATFKKNATAALTERTVGNSSVTINVPNNWCLNTVSVEPGFNSFNPDWTVTNIEGADTLVIGFSSMTDVLLNATPPGNADFMSELTLGNSATPQASFSRLLVKRGLANNAIVSSSDYYLYSQMWTLHNPSFSLDSGRTASSSGSDVTLTGATSKALTLGTVLSVPDATNVFFRPRKITGAIVISENQLLVPLTTPAADMPVVGDAVFGPQVRSGTFIMGAGQAQANGTLFAVTTGQKPNPTGQTLYVRAAVVSVGTPNTPNSSTNPSSFTNFTSFRMSRPPDTPLVAQRLCGGLCALFQTGVAGQTLPDADINLIGVQAGDEWSLGLTCLSGVKAQGIEMISGPPLRRVAWNEVVR